MRAAAYTPAWGPPGARVPGPDEDPFTLAATVAERATSGGRLPPSLTVDLLAEGPGPSDGMFGSLLGTRVVLQCLGSGSDQLRTAVAAGSAGADPRLVIAVDVAGPGDGGAVALFFDSRGEGPPPPPLPPPAGTGPESAVRLAHRWFRESGSSDLDRWVGDWTPSSAPGPTPPSVAPPAPSVSQGAYLPRPRYEEGLPGRWRFLAERCGHCGVTRFPPRGRCRSCGRSDRQEAVPLPLDGGTVVAVTVIGPGGQPTEFDPQVEASGPYGVALVEVAPGIRATLQLTDVVPGEIRVGDRVGTRLRRLYAIDGEWRYGRKAVPFVPGPGRAMVPADRA